MGYRRTFSESAYAELIEAVNKVVAGQPGTKIKLRSKNRSPHTLGGKIREYLKLNPHINERDFAVRVLSDGFVEIEKKMPLHYGVEVVESIEVEEPTGIDEGPSRLEEGDK